METLLSVLADGWDISPRTVRPCPKSKRLLEIVGLGFARVTFPRGPLTAIQVVELLAYLHDGGCAVPEIVKTRDGDLAVELDGVAIAVETRLPGVECSANTLEVLPLAGSERLGEVSSHSRQLVPVVDDWHPLLEVV